MAALLRGQLEVGKGYLEGSGAPGIYRVSPVFRQYWMPGMETGLPDVILVSVNSVLEELSNGSVLVVEEKTTQPVENERSIGKKYQFHYGEITA